MKTLEISETVWVRRYGVRGAKLFARVWFPMPYLWLVALNAGLWVVAPEFPAGWRRILAGCIIGALIVAAASLLARMRLQYLAAINRLESRGITA